MVYKDEFSQKIIDGYNYLCTEGPILDEDPQKRDYNLQKEWTVREKSPGTIDKVKAFFGLSFFPFGKQFLKFSKLSLMPFGATIS